MSAEPLLAHTVFFTLHDNSAQAKQKLVAACKECLAGQPGVAFFAAGTLAGDIDWSVSDRDFDVALYLVFENKAAHDQYQESAEHLRFMAEHESNWKQIRSFDAYVRPRK